MQDSGPSTLITPTLVDITSSSILDLSPMVLAVVGVVLICAPVVYILRQRQKMDPRELAFRTMTRKMGYTHQEVGMLRKYAVSLGLGSPIGIIMNHELAAQALGE